MADIPDNFADGISCIQLQEGHEGQCKYAFSCSSDSEDDCSSVDYRHSPCNADKKCLPAAVVPQQPGPSGPGDVWARGWQRMTTAPRSLAAHASRCHRCGVSVGGGAGAAHMHPMSGLLCCIVCLRQLQLAELEDSDEECTPKEDQARKAALREDQASMVAPKEHQARLVIKMLEDYTDDEEDDSQSEAEEPPTKSRAESSADGAGESTAESDNDGAGTGGSDSSLVTSEAEDEGKASPSNQSYTNTDDECNSNGAAMPRNSGGSRDSKRDTTRGGIYVAPRLRATSDARVAYAQTQRQTQRQLQPSPTSWAGQMRLRRRTADLASAEESARDLARNARALLNKLTIDRFEVLCAQVLALPLSSEEHLSSLVEEVFKKATTEHGFCSLYADLCSRIDAHVSELEDSPVGGRCFRRALLNACQVRFDQERSCAADTAVADLEGDELFEMQMKLKRGRLGNMRFIGELLNRKLLAGRVLPHVCQELLEAADDSCSDTVAAGAAIESLVALLHVVGPHHHETTSPVSMALNEVFSSLRSRSRDESISSRIRFLIRDLLDLRSRDWQAPPPARPAPTKSSKEGRKKWSW